MPSMYCDDPIAWTFVAIAFFSWIAMMCERKDTPRFIGFALATLLFCFFAFAWALKPTTAEPQASVPVERVSDYHEHSMFAPIPTDPESRRRHIEAVEARTDTLVNELMNAEQ